MIDQIVDETLDILGFKLNKEQRVALKEDILRSPPAGSATLKEVLYYGTRNIEEKCKLNNTTCNAELITAYTPTNHLAGMIWIHTEKTMVTEQDQPYATMIGITSSVPYLLARHIQPELPSVVSLLIPFLTKHLYNTVDLLYVNPLYHIGEVLQGKYGFSRVDRYTRDKTGKEREKYIENLHGCRGGEWMGGVSHPVYVLDLSLLAGI